VSKLHPTKAFIVTTSNLQAFVTCLTDSAPSISRVAIDIMEENRLSLMLNIEEGGKPNASILYEMPHQERDEEREVYNYEERQASDPGYLPGVRH
jgi:hypothetical protein